MQQTLIFSLIAGLVLSFSGIGNGQVPKGYIAAPDPDYDDFTWTLPSTASSVRLSLPTDIDNFLFNEYGGIGGYGLCAGGHIEGLDHVWIEFIPGTPARSWAPGTVMDIALNDQEYHIWIDYGDNLIGIHMEIMTPYVSVGQTVARGQEVGMGMSFNTNQTSGEMALIDLGRTDGNEAWGGGCYVSPFDYLRDADKQILVNAYKQNVIQPYQNDGTRVWGFEPQQPYLTNKLRLHDDNAGKLTGVWYLPASNWFFGYPNDILTIIEADNPYITGNIIKSQDWSGSRGDAWSLHGTCDVDYAFGKIVIYDEAATYYGIFVIDETGDRATLRIEYQEHSYPSGFSTNALIYTEREYYTYIPLAGDFDGDGKTDPALYQELSGRWSVMLSAGRYEIATTTLGGSGYNPIAKDFDGDGKADLGVYNETNGNWTISLSDSGYGVVTLSNFGGVGYVTVVGDYDGDGKADPAVYHEATGSWEVKVSGNSYASVALLNFGNAGYSALALDFDGDGQADPALYNTASGNWIVKLSGSDYTSTSITSFGGAGYLQVAGMFDGDNRADPALYNSSNGNWSVLLSDSNYLAANLAGFGGPDYTAMVGDYDGDGLVDPALYQESTSTWFVKLSASGYTTATATQ
ncbi:MAG: hypothetical protein HYV35_06675 [Lentisphaerae bacterium]|nr:hypothetical protein [Lentisphaerota bacterium]